MAEEKSDSSSNSLVPSDTKRFLKYRSQRQNLGRSDEAAIKRLFCILRSSLVVAPEPARIETPAMQVVNEFACYLKEERGLAPSTMQRYQNVLHQFLHEVFGEAEVVFSTITPAHIIDFVSNLTKELGAPVYERIDAPANSEQKDKLKKLSSDQITTIELAGEKIIDKLTADPGNGASLGGLKVVTENGWFAARPSSTEEVYKIYAESFRDTDHLKQIQKEAQELVTRVLSPAVQRS
jgi:hypothetical protein